MTAMRRYCIFFFVVFFSTAPFSFAQQDERKFLLREYDFSTVDRSEGSVKNLASPEGTPLLQYKTDEPWEIVEGFKPGSKAVRLDGGYFESDPFEVKNSFAVEMRVKILGPGTQTGNDGSKNGTLFGMGDGYWSGMRYTIDCNHWSSGLAIGRAKPSSAVHLGVEQPFPLNTWTHVYAAWDGQQMSIYINGILQSNEIFYENFEPAGWGFRIGYNNAGVGSVKMDVDSVRVYSEPLDFEEILRRGVDCDLPRPFKDSYYCDTHDSMSRQSWTGALSMARVMEKQAETPQERSIGRFLRANILTHLNRQSEAMALFASLAEDGNCPAVLRENALRNCVPSDAKTPLIAAKDNAFYRDLLKLPGLTDNQKKAIEKCIIRLAASDSEQKYRSALAEFQREDEIALSRKKIETLIAEGFVPDFRAEEAGKIAPPTNPLPQSFKPSVTFFVAPNGNAGAEGTKANPFATLVQARDAIRALRKQRLENGESELPEGGIAVEVRGGTYEMPPQLLLEEQDSGTAESPIVYRNFGNEKPVFHGSRALKGFTKVSDATVLQRVPKEAHGKLMQVNLADCGIDVKMLPQIAPRGFGANGPGAAPWLDVYVNDKPLQIARYPNVKNLGNVTENVFLRTGEILSEHKSGVENRKPGVFSYSDERINRWTQAEDLWFFGYWKHLWAANSVKLEKLDVEKKQITVTTGANPYGYVKDAPFYAFNLLEEIDVPGEWFLDRKTGILYFYPPEEEIAKMRLTVLDRPFVRLKNVSHTVFYRLNFGDGCASGAVAEGGNDVTFAGCVFQRFGAWGLSLHGKNHRVIGCDVFQLGGGGISMSGGDVRTLTPGGCLIENNHIADLTRVDLVYGPAVSLDGVGNRIAHNLMHHSPAHGMRMGGFDHLVELNEIHSVVYESDDQSGIDMYGNPTWRGNVIRYNYWHHIGSGRDVAGQSGIRLDDMISGVFMYGNVFYKSADGHFGGIQVHGGKDNISINNLFLDCKAAFSFSSWGERRWLERLEKGSFADAVRSSGVDVTQEPFASRYPPLKDIRENADRNFIFRNAAVDCGSFTLHDRGVNELLDNVHVSSAILKEQDRIGFDELGRPVISPDWPVYRMIDMRPLPLEKMGLYRDSELRSEQQSEPRS